MAEDIKNLDECSEYDAKSIQTNSSGNYFSYHIEGPSDPHKMGCCSSFVFYWWDKTLGKIGGDWLFLILLGISMSWISFLVEHGIGFCNTARIYLYRDLVNYPFLQYLGWIWLPVCLILFSTAFTRLVAPQAAGSGIPEMKTILKGVMLKDSLNCKALIAKLTGLTTTLGTGLPLGKEGPYVHIASMVALLLTKATIPFRGIYKNKTRYSEMLGAACAVGVATAFATPVGGVLFSIEVTAVHFAVRNYWRGFFAAVCATLMNRLIAVWFKNEDTLTAVFRTRFSLDTPYSPEEVIIFALMGVICGFLGALFVWMHKKYVAFKNTNRVMKTITKQSMLLYPFLVTLLYTSLTFPLGLGMFVAGELTTQQEVAGLFSNFSWVKENPSIHEYDVISHWRSPHTGIFVNLSIYVVFTFFGTILASTIPVPAGIFIPVFKTGAAFGRIIGELMYFFFSNGTAVGIFKEMITPGGYAIVGAAALAGAVTHTVSSSVIAFELTGQMTFAIPVMVAVFIANGIAQVLQPSIFDSIITMKKLPYLPSIPSTSSKAYDIYVEDFMVRDVKFIWYGISYNQLKLILSKNKKLKTFPIVDSSDSMILLGSANRRDLITLIKDSVGPQKKLELLNDWKLEAERVLEEKMKLQGCNKSPRVQIKDVFERERKPSDNLPKHSSPKASNKNEDQKKASTPGPQDDSNQDKPRVISVPILERRPSRFSVTKVEGPFSHPPPDEDKEAVPDEAKKEQDPSGSPNSASTDESLPRKGILKKTQSFVFESNESPELGLKYPYATIHAGDSRSLRLSLGSVLKAKSLLKMDSKQSRITFTGVSRADFPTSHLVEKIKELERKWEENEMKKTVNFAPCHINPAPHQLVERTNLLQVHSIFSLLGLQHSYVTAIGRLIGVVGLKELRQAIERVNSGEFSRKETHSHGRRFSFGFLSLR